MKKKRWIYDIILIAALVVLAGVLWFGNYIMRETGAEVMITVDGQERGRYSLKKDQEILIESNGENVLIIEDGTARIEQADCPDKICVKTGKIQYKGETIVCLPHKVVVEIVKGDESNIDAVSR